jgi:hypothetical protein
LQSKCFNSFIMNDSSDAMNKISEIYSQLSKTGVYRGYKPHVIAFSGIISIIAAILKPYLILTQTSMNFIIYWVIIAVINLTICTLMILYQYFFKENQFERQKTLIIMIQFIPMIIAGGIATIFLSYNDGTSILLLPGIWAILFGMGIFNVRPYLTNLTIIAAIFYFISSIVLFYLKFYHVNLLSIGMGLTFGIGQLLSAFILYWSIEKNNHEKQ